MNIFAQSQAFISLLFRTYSHLFRTLFSPRAIYLNFCVSAGFEEQVLVLYFVSERSKYANDLSWLIMKQVQLNTRADRTSEFRMSSPLYEWHMFLCQIQIRFIADGIIQVQCWFSAWFVNQKLVSEQPTSIPEPQTCRVRPYIQIILRLVSFRQEIEIQLSFWFAHSFNSVLR